MVDTTSFRSDRSRGQQGLEVEKSRDAGWASLVRIRNAPVPSGRHHRRGKLERVDCGLQAVGEVFVCG